MGVAAAVLAGHGDAPGCGPHEGSSGAEIQRQENGLCGATPSASEAEECSHCSQTDFTWLK